MGIAAFITGLAGIALCVLIWVVRCVCYLEGLHDKESPKLLLSIVSLTESIFLISLACWFILQFNLG